MRPYSSHRAFSWSRALDREHQAVSALAQAPVVMLVIISWRLWAAADHCMFECAHTEADGSALCKGDTSMTIDVATGISRILREEGVGWVSTFPVCRVNNALGREGVPMLMMRD